MDFATLIGLFVGTTVVALAILSGSDPSIFVNAPGLLIVIGGTLAVTLIKFPLFDTIHAIIRALKQAFWEELDTPEGLIAEAHNMAKIARKKDLLALEGYEIKNPFLRIGVRLSVDGRPPEFIRDRVAHQIGK